MPLNTTLQNIISTVRTANILSANQVNYGITDQLQPPYISIEAFEFELVYQTCAPSTRHSTFHVVCIEKTADAVQALAQQVFDLLDRSTTLTPNADACLLLHYKVGQTATIGTSDKPLYQWAVDLEFRLDESNLT